MHTSGQLIRNEETLIKNVPNITLKKFDVFQRDQKPYVNQQQKQSTILFRKEDPSHQYVTTL